MSIQTQSQISSLPQTPSWNDWSGAKPGLDAAKPELAPAVLEARPEEVSFDLDAGSVQTSNEKSDQWNTSYEVSGAVSVRAPGGESTEVPVRYEVTMRKEDTSPARMAEVNPFDPSTIPPRARIEVHGADYVGTAFEPAFRELAAANDLESIADLRLSLEMTDKKGLRVMTGSEEMFNAPTAHGPGSHALDREDFTRHTTMLADPAGAGFAQYNRMLLTGQMPDGTAKVAEDVQDGGVVVGTVAEIGSGEVNDITWHLDEAGRPVSGEAVLTWEPTSRGRDSDRIEKSAQSGFRVDNEMKGTGDDVGHLFAYRFVQGHGEVNMFPQFSSFNQGAYAKMEQEWSDWIGAGMEVRIDIDLQRSNGSHRPDEVHVDYEVIDPETGKMVYDPALIAFENTSGQTFDFIAARDMAGMIDKAVA